MKLEESSLYFDTITSVDADKYHLIRSFDQEKSASLGYSNEQSFVGYICIKPVVLEIPISVQYYEYNAFYPIILAGSETKNMQDIAINGLIGMAFAYAINLFRIPYSLTPWYIELLKDQFFIPSKESHMPALMTKYYVNLSTYFEQNPALKN